MVGFLKFMRGVMLFVAGWTARLAVQVAVAQSGNTGLVMMNHVGINVANIPEAVTTLWVVDGCHVTA